ncbi:MAG: M61 family peptidase, partial [Sulfolobaceae archaeon]|nr:M61 family peptidase [Sulfolobaceae archaeon]
MESKNKYIYVKGRGVAGKQIVFPTWVPGSYFIREQEKNVVMLRGASLVSKNKYFLTDDEFEYVYSAISKDQRETISTVDYIFINPVSVFPYQDLNEEYCISLKLPNNWVVHTTLKEIGKFTYCAKNYDEFADSPIQASPKLNLIKVTEFHSISTVNNINELDKLSKVLNFLDSSLSIENEDKQSYIFFFRRSDVNFGG